jgi:hypothetical protein
MQAKRDLREAIQELKTYVIEREGALFWKFLAHSLALLGAQRAAITWMMSHWKP